MTEIGSVEILVDRIYPINSADRSIGRPTVVVFAGTYPLHFEDGYYFWRMTGVRNKGGVQVISKGLFTISAGDVVSDETIEVDSHKFTPTEFVDFMANDPVCKKDHVEHRLNFNLRANL